MKDIDEKELIKLKFAICLNAFIERNKELGIKANDKKSFINGLRKLEAASGVSFPIIQLASVANRDIQLTTTMRLIENLGIQSEEFFKMYDNLSEKEIRIGKERIQARKRNAK